MEANINLTTKRLVLRPAKVEDAEAIFNYRSNSVTNKYQGWIPKNRTDVNHFLANISKENNSTDTWFQFDIIDIEKSTIIGDLGIHFLDEEQAEIGCTLAKKNHGNRGT